MTGSLSLSALFMFAIVFCWTPPHFWTLAIVRRQDYASVGVPMLPVVRGDRAARVQVLRYVLITLAVSLLPALFGPLQGVYALAALALGGLFVHYALQMLRRADAASSWRLYKYSILYLALLFVAMAVDRLILGGG